MTTERLVVPGELRLECLVAGPEADEAVVFVHGLGASCDQFAEQLRSFGGARRAVAPSLRGHGGSGWMEPPPRRARQLWALASDVVRVLDHLEIQRAHLVGNSMGGLVCWELLGGWPERVASVCTFGTAASLEYSRTGARLLFALDRLLGPRGNALLAGRMASKDRAVAERFAALVRKMSPRALVELRQAIAEYDYLPVVAAAPVPVLVLRCERDKMINAALTPTLAVVGRGARGRVVDLPGAGHLANLDAPEAFDEALESFLSSI